MNEQIHIREATPDDARLIAAFNREMAFETEGARLDPEVSLAGVCRMIQDRNLGFYLVGEHEQEIVGLLMITTEWSDWRNGVFWWIQSVYVIPRWRRKGVYRRLYQEVQKLAGANPDVCGYRLYVERENTAAQATYRSVGMTETRYKMYEELSEKTAPS